MELKWNIYWNYDRNRKKETFTNKYTAYGGQSQKHFKIGHGSESGSGLGSGSGSGSFGGHQSESELNSTSK